MTKDEQLADAWEYARSYYKDAEVEREFELLSEFQPDVGACSGASVASSRPASVHAPTPPSSTAQAPSWPKCR